MIVRFKRRIVVGAYRLWMTGDKLDKHERFLIVFVVASLLEIHVWNRICYEGTHS